MKVKTRKELAAERAVKFVGVREHPAGSNRGPDVIMHGEKGGIDYWCKLAAGVVGYPWCSAFVCGMYSAVGCPIPERRRAGVEYLDQWATKLGFYVKSGKARRGDIVCYDWDADNWDDHVGIVLRVIKAGPFGYIKTVEGNTSAGNDSNGGQVQIRYRRLTGNVRFIRVNCTKF
jgi:hypothetical protein